MNCWEKPFICQTIKNTYILVFTKCGICLSWDSAYWNSEFLIWQDVNLIQKDIFVLEALFALFGAGFCLFAKEQLPTYYDENELHYVSDGVFRMNIPFIRIHNSNWPYIVKCCRYWMLGSMILFPVVSFLLVTAGLWESSQKAVTLIWVFGLFGTILGTGKYYE